MCQPNDDYYDEEFEEYDEEWIDTEDDIDIDEEWDDEDNYDEDDDAK